MSKQSILTVRKILAIAVIGECLFKGETCCGVDKSLSPPAFGDSAKDFELRSVNGKTVRLYELTRRGPVVLVVLRGFPGYQCPICARQVTALSQRARDFVEAGARVLFVYPGPGDKLKARAREFLRGQELPEPMHLLLDPDYSFVSAYGLRWDAPNETAYPSTFVIGTDNRIIFAAVSKTHGDRARVSDVINALPKKRQ